MGCAAAAMLVLVLGASACAQVATLDSGSCGNGVVDSDEDCDRGPLGADDWAGCGQPGSALACRLVCETSADCPDGWGCGRDGACRHGTGAFEEIGKTEWSATQWTLGDVDGDGEQDVASVGTPGAEVRYGPGPAWSAPAAGVAPAMVGTLDGLGLATADFDGDQRMDLAVPTRNGVAVFQGDAERRLVPTLHASFSGPLVTWALPLETLVDPMQDGYETETLGLWDTPDGPTSVLTAFTPGGFDVGPFVSVCDPVCPGASLAGLGRTIPHGWMTDGGSDGRTVLLFAFPGLSVAYVMDSAIDGLGRKSPWMLPIALGRGSEIARGPGASPAPCGLFADMDGNGALDVVLSVKDPAGKLRVEVALNVGGGEFAVPAADPRFDTVGMPLAAGDLDRDQRTDFVAADGIYLARPTGLAKLASDAQKPFSEAVVLDEDGDCQPDGVALTDDESVLVWACPGTCKDVVFAPLAAGATQAPWLLRGGDFHGRAHPQHGCTATPEVAFVERIGDAGRVNLVDVKSIEVTAVGRLSGVERMERSEGPNGADGLVITAAGDSPSSQRRFAIMTGSRAGMTSPLALLDGFATYPAVGALAGRFVEGRSGLVASSADKPRAWLHEMDSHGTLAREAPPSDERRALGLDQLDLACTLSAIGSLDGSGTDSLVVLVDSRLCGMAPEEVPPGLFVATFDASSTLRLEAAVLDPADVGRPQTLRVVEAGSRAQVAVAGETGVATYQLDHGSLKAVEQISTDSSVFDAVLAQIDAEAQPTLLVLTPNGVERTTPEGLVPVVAGDWVPGPGAHVAVADLDHDGVIDLVLGGPSELRVARGVPSFEPAVQ